MLAPVEGPFACDAVEANLALAWTVVDAATYDVVLNGQVVARDLPDAAFRFSPDTVFAPRNTVAVVARTCSGEATSNVIEFDATADTLPLAVGLQGPENNGAVYCDPTLQWQTNQAGAWVTYEVRISSADGVEVTQRVTDEALHLDGEARLPAGQYQWRVATLSCVGDEALSAQRRFVVETTPPAPVLLRPAVDEWRAPQPTLSWTHEGAQPDVVFDVVIDGATVATDLPQSPEGPARYQLARALHGEHTAQIVARGCFGASAQSGEPRPFRVDAEPPPPFALVRPGEGWTNAEPLVFEWTFVDEAPDEGAGLERCEVHVDGAPVGTAPAPASTWAGANLGLPDGAHTWQVTCVDQFANSRQSPVGALRYDATPPSAPTLMAPAADGAATNAPLPTFTWEEATDATSGLAGYVVLLNGEIASGVVPADTRAWRPEIDLPEGDLSWAVRAIDAAGNAASSAPRPLTLDRAPPDAPELLAPAGVTGELQLCWRPTADTCTVDVFVDDVPTYVDLPVGDARIDPDSGCIDFFDIPDDGPHAWSVVAMDCAGNRSDEAEGAFVLETLPPERFVALEPANGVTVHTLEPLFCWAPAVDRGVGVDHYLLRVDGDAELRVAPEPEDGAVCARLPAALSNGAHQWQVTAVDGAGNRRAATGMPWGLTVDRDLTAPVATITAPEPDTLTGCVAFTFAGAASDLGPDGRRGSGVVRVEYQLDDTADGGWVPAELTGSERNRTWQAAWDGVNGAHTLHVRAIDREGNVQDEPAQRRFTADCEGPRPTALTAPVDHGFATACPEFRWQPTQDELVDVARYVLHVEQADSTPIHVIDVGLGTRHTMAGDDCLPEGRYVWRVRAYDALGNGRDSAESRTLKVDLSGPAGFPLLTQAPVNQAGWLADDQLTVTWSPAEDREGVGMDDAPYQVVLDGEPVGERTAQTTFMLHGLSEGAHTWTVWAFDALGNRGEATVTPPLGAFTVDLQAPAAPLRTAPPPEAVVNTPTLRWAPSLDAPGAPSGVCRYLVRVGPQTEAVPLEAHALPWPHPLPEGEVTWTVDAEDCAGNVSAADRQVMVVDTVAPEAPAVLSPAAQVYAALPMARWAPGDDPAGICAYMLAFDGVAQRLPPEQTEAALPGDWVDGVHEVAVRAEDCAGNLGAATTATFTLDRQAPLPAELRQPADGACLAELPTLRWARAEDATSEIASHTARLDGVDHALPREATRYLPDALDDGAHTWSVLADDEAGWTSESATWDFTLDREAPTCAVVRLGAGPDGLTVEGASADAGPCGLATVEVRVDGGPWTSVVVDDGLWRHEVEALSEGEHSVACRAVDVAGLIGEATGAFAVTPCMALGDCVDGRCDIPADGDCTPADRCALSGRCIDGVCAVVDVRECDVVPEPSCDGDVLTRWSSPGVCQADGQCHFERQFTRCAHGCDAGACLDQLDPCEGVVCNQPPSSCFAAGVCQDGRCEYPRLAAGSACDDGDACTASSRCDNGGRCVGAVAPCEAPAPVCEGDRVITFTQGACADGECVFVETDALCPGGCVDGACPAPSCEGVVCADAPGPCFDADGWCEGGGCHYAPLDAGTVCDDGDACTEDGVCDGAGRCQRGAAVTCAAPPAPWCEGDSLVIPHPGRCAAGECAYDEARVECPFGCDADLGACAPEPCAEGCQTPPSGCHAPEGVCDEGSGECRYDPQEGAACDDDNPCTFDDSCGADGACVGTPCAHGCGDEGCLEPPADAEPIEDAAAVDAASEDAAGIELDGGITGRLDDGGAPNSPSPSKSESGGCACRADDGGTPAFGLLVALLALGGPRRRRSTRTRR